MNGNQLIPSISIIIPTIGKPTLGRVVFQIQPQLQDHDELIVASDGINANVKALVENLNDSRIKYIEYTPGPSGNRGHTVRNYVMPLATGTHLYFLDDDDELLPNALNVIREAIVTNTDKIIIFRIHHDSSIIWNDRKITIGNVGTQMFVVPKCADKLGKWKEQACGDYYFIESCASKYPRNSIVWREEIIAIHGISK